MLRSVRVWLGILITLLFLGLFFRQTNFGEIKTSFEQANYYIAFASLPVYFVGIWVRTIRWQYLLRRIKRISVWRLYPVVIIGLMANNMMPARAGELVRAYILGEREQMSKAASLGTIAVDRLFDGLTLVPMMVIVAAFVGSGQSFPLTVVDYNLSLFGLAIVMAVLFGAALGVLFVMAFSERWRNRADGFVMTVTPKRFRPSIEGLTHSFFDGLHSLRSPVDLFAAWIMSAISWTLEALMYYMVGRAFGLHAGFQYYLLATAAANLAISVLASQGGIGPFELVTKQIIVAGGVTESAAKAYAIGLHALVLLPVIAVGLYMLGAIGMSLGEMFRGGSQRSSALPEQGPDRMAAAALPSKEMPGS